jgi:hypothetical protein
MALTAVITDKIELGGTKREYWVVLTPDNSWAATGEPLTLTGMERIASFQVQPTGGYTFSWDAANQKLLAYMGDNDGVADGPGVEASTKDLSALRPIGVAKGN